MMRLLGSACLLLAVACVVGCAVTEPDDRDTARVRAAVEHDRHVSITELANELGVSEVAVVAALPESMRVELAEDDLPGALVAVCRIAPVRLGMPGDGAGEGLWVEVTFRIDALDNDQLTLHGDNGSPLLRMDPARIDTVWLCRLDSMGPASRAVLFFDSGGERIMTWQAVDTPASIDAFDRVWRDAGR